MKSEVPVIHTEVTCLQSKETREVDFEINVFRGAEKGGVEVTACSEFLQGKGAVTCGQDCIHTQIAHDVHQHAVQHHQRELAEIGSNVIG